jgi:hypothetical protein
MPTVIGVFREEARALEVIEGLRTVRFDTASVRLIGGAKDVTEFAAQAGSSAKLAAGPPGAVLAGLEASELSVDDLKTVEQGLESGGVALLARDLDPEDEKEFVTQLREHQADQVFSQAR